MEPPVRIPLDTKPVFTGIGTSQEGCVDATLFSALIEVKPEYLGQKLVTDWHTPPVISAISK